MFSFLACRAHMLAVHLLAIVFSFNGLLLRPSATAVRTRQAVAEQPSLAKLQAVIGLAEREANGQLKIARALRPVVAITAGVIAATSGSLDGLLSPPAPAAAVVTQVRRQPAQLQQRAVFPSERGEAGYTSPRWKRTGSPPPLPRPRTYSSCAAA